MTEMLNIISSYLLLLLLDIKKKKPTHIKGMLSLRMLLLDKSFQIGNYNTTGHGLSTPETFNWVMNMFGLFNGIKEVCLISELSIEPILSQLYYQILGDIIYSH